MGAGITVQGESDHTGYGQQQERGKRPAICGQQPRPYKKEQDTNDKQLSDSRIAHPGDEAADADTAVIFPIAVVKQDTNRIYKKKAG